MSRLRLRKIIRDLWSARTRTALMITAVAVSVLAVGAVLSARAIVSREISQNYLATAPASATLRVPSGVDAATVAVVRAQPAILDATARASAPARVRVGDGPWRMMTLFAADPADPQRIARVAMEHGSWPPAPDGLVLERTALPFLGVRDGQRVQVQVAGGPPTTMRVTGSAHDGGVAPAGQEQTAYAYTTVQALARLGLPPARTDLKIVVGDGRGPSGDRATIEAVAQRVAAVLRARGAAVDHIEVPRPLSHPHRGQMQTVSFTLLAFGGAALLLSSILVATMLGGMLAGQIRQIGAMKAVGARTGQILGMYLAMTAVIAATATALAVAPGAWLGRVLAGEAARLLNLDLADTTVPGWVWALVIAAGVGVPLLVALVPLARGSRVTVREAIDDHGAGPSPGNGRAERVLARLRWLPRPQLLAARNLIRRRGRLALNVGLLAVAGAMFLTGLNTASGWTALVDQGLSHRQDDMEVRLGTPVPADRLTSLARAVSGVADAQAWARTPTTVHASGKVDVARVYPDDAHGSFTVLAPRADTALLRRPLTAGRWLRPGETGTVVLNNLSVAQVPGVKVGDRLTLTVAGRPTTWRVVGLAADFGSQGTAYVTDRSYAAATGQAGMAAELRVVTYRHDAASRQAVLDRLETALNAAGVPVEQAFRVDDLRAGLDGHVLVLASTLIVLGSVMGLVGLLGLAASLATGVTERTREFGVLYAIGARPGQVRGIVVTEGALTAALSVAIAVLLALPLTSVLGDFIGDRAFRQPLPYQFTAAPLVVWIVLAVAGAVLAATAAARRATRLTVREALTTL